jgi:hypothetical protein
MGKDNFSLPRPAVLQISLKRQSRKKVASATSDACRNTRGPWRTVTHQICGQKHSRWIGTVANSLDTWIAKDSGLLGPRVRKTGNTRSKLSLQSILNH